MGAARKQAKPRRGSSPAARRWCRPAAYAALLAVACVGLAALVGAALEHAGLRLVESDRARAVRLLTWASQLSALGPAAAGRLVHRAPLVGTRLAGAFWSGLQPESSYALGHAMLQVAATALTRTLTRTLNLTLTLTRTPTLTLTLARCRSCRAAVAAATTAWRWRRRRRRLT